MQVVRCHLRHILRSRQVSQVELRVKTGLARATVSNLFNNHVKQIERDTVLRICQALRCDSNDLFEIVKVEDVKRMDKYLNQQDYKTIDLDPKGWVCNLASFVKRDGLKILEFSVNSKISIPTVSGLVENTFEAVRTSVLIKLCQYFNCGLDELFRLEYGSLTGIGLLEAGDIINMADSAYQYLGLSEEGLANFQKLTAGKKIKTMPADSKWLEGIQPLYKVYQK